MNRVGDGSELSGADAGDYVANQYVTFQLNDEAFALPMTTVLEIIRVPDTVEVPLTPPSLVGLANLRGGVLPVLDLRSVLGMPRSECNEATRVMVVDAGRAVGLVVDKVARVLAVDEKQIVPADQVGATVDSDLLHGVAKNIGGLELIQLLDVEKAIHREFATVVRSVASGLGELGSATRLSERVADDEDDSTSQLVSFVVEDQEYAFDISEVEEIVRVPEEISRVPHSGAHVLGLINLRGQLLPLVSLRRMFALPEHPVDEHNRIVVVSVGRGPVHQSVGIVVDRVKEVLRIAQDVQDSIPALLREGLESNEISAVCRLDDGRRLVSVLSACALFQTPAIRRAMEMHAPEENGAEMTNELKDEITEDDETQLVVFLLAEQEFSVAIDAVQEITRVPETMTRVPQTPEFIEGLVNLRGSVLPVLDMWSRFGFDRVERNDRQRILVLDLNGVRTGFITDAVLEVLRLSRTLIEEAPPLSEEQARIMGKVVNFREKKRMIQVLDVEELLDKREHSALKEAV